MAKYLGDVIRDDIKELIIETPMDTVEFKADIIFPEKGVKNTSGRIPKLPTGAGMKMLDLKRPPRSSYKRGKWVWSNESYTTEEFGYEEPVDHNEALENADIFSEEVVSGAIAKSQLFLAREKRAADGVFNATTFTGAANSLTVTHEMDDATNAVIEENITAAQAKSFAKNGRARAQHSLICNDIVFNNIMRTDKVRADVKYTKDIASQSRAVQAAYLANYLHIKDVIVVTSFYDTSAIGIADGTFETLWSGEYAMYCVLSPNLDSWKVPGLGRQPVWRPYSPDYVVESYVENQTRSTIIRVREYRGLYVDATFGVLMDNMTS